MVAEITVAFNKTGVSVAFALEVELETRPNLLYIISQNVGLVNKSNEASVGVLESGFTRPQA